MIYVTTTISIDESELTFEFVRSSGPGGQNVNKVSTTVQLRFDAAHSSAIPPAVFERLRAVAGRRMTKDGVVVIRAGRYRTQEGNRQDAVARRSPPHGGGRPGRRAPRASGASRRNGAAATQNAGARPYAATRTDPPPGPGPLSP
jgi:protein subunit release factor B